MHGKSGKLFLERMDTMEITFKFPRVRITIKSIQGKCPQGFKEGDTWLIEKNITPSNFCMTAFHAIYPALRTMRYGGDLPWGKKGNAMIQCPDYHNPVIYELERLEEGENES